MFVGLYLRPLRYRMELQNCDWLVVKHVTACSKARCVRSEATAAPVCCRRMGLDNLWKPDLRGRIEQGISRIAAGQVTKDTVSGNGCSNATATYAMCGCSCGS
jgi:hypothetical protein